MSNLLTELQQLQSNLADIGEKYRTTKKELHQLKTRPLVDVAELEQANEQLALVIEHNNSLEERIQQQKLAYEELEKRTNALYESYQVKEAELSKANEMIDQLIEKNRLATEHAKTVLANLTKIDNHET